MRSCLGSTVIPLMLAIMTVNNQDLNKMKINPRTKKARNNSNKISNDMWKSWILSNLITDYKLLVNRM